MDDDKIGLVLAKTSELRSRIISSIRKSSDAGEHGKGTESNSKEFDEAGSAEESREDDNDEETESLLNIKDALESLEGQLSSLQALQQQQWYEKESALAEIEYSRKKLLKELTEYKGKDLEIIHEIIAFTSETEDNSDLLLPPYPTRPSHSDEGYLPSFPSVYKFAQNGGTRNLHGESKNHHESEGRGPFKWVKVLIGAVAKTSLTLVGVVAIMSLSGFELRLRKPGNQFKVSELLKLQGNDEKQVSLESPPGKIPTVERNEVRCVAKERVEIPFEPIGAIPDLRYGYG